MLNHYDSKTLIGLISTKTQFNIELNHLREDSKSPNNFLNHVYILNITGQSIMVIQCYDEIKSNEISDLTDQVIYFV